MPGASDAAARSWSGFGWANGSAFIGKAEMTSDAAGQSKILEDFRQKYWQTPVLARRDRCDSGPRVAPSRGAASGCCTRPDSRAPSPRAAAPSPGSNPARPLIPLDAQSIGRPRRCHACTSKIELRHRRDRRVARGSAHSVPTSSFYIVTRRNLCPNQTLESASGVTCRSLAKRAD
jgi:hypothetical protein